MAEMSWAYVSGFFDGEGTLNISWIGKKSSPGNTYSTLRCGMFQSGEEGQKVLNEISDFLSTFDIRGRVGARKMSIYKSHYGRRQMYALEIGRRSHVAKFLAGVLPYSRVKKTIIQDVLRYLVMFPSIHGPTALRELDESKMREDRQSGLSYRDIGERHGFSPTYTKRIIEKGARKFAWITMKGQ